MCDRRVPILVSLLCMLGLPLATPAESESVSPEVSAKPPAAATVVVGHNKLDPAVVKIKAGQSVTFRNVDQMPGGHTVVADDGSFKSSPLEQKGEWTHTFDAKGAFGIHIKEHPSARARIVVE